MRERTTSSRLAMALLGLAAGAGGAAAPLRTISLDGVPYIPLRRIAEMHGKRFVQTDDGMILLRGRNTVAGFEVDSRRVSVNGTRVWLHAAALDSRRGPAISRVDLDRTISPLVQSAPTLRAYRARVIVLDPGHGGSDTGAVGGGGLREKDVVLDLARRIRDRLAARGFEVHLTRDEDRTLSIADRAAFAARMQADLLVSIHLNGAANTEAQGVETFVLTSRHQPSTHESSPGRTADGHHAGQAHEQASTLLGFELQHALRRGTGIPDRGLRLGRFQLLRDAPCPAALIECAFLTNPEEEAKLGTDAFRNRIADGAAEGIAAYARRVQAAGGGNRR